MDSLVDSIRAVSAFPGPSSSSKPASVLAQRFMTSNLLLLRPDQTVAEAIRVLVKGKISGAPVVNSRGQLVGVLSELDCMKVVASAAFHQEGPAADKTVGDLMSPALHTITPETDLYSVVHMFMTHRVRRLPVMSHGKLVGIVSRRDVLRAMHSLYE